MPIDARRIALIVLAVTNGLLLVALIWLSYGSQRQSFGRTTGLVTTCEAGIGHGNLDSWTPATLLIVVVPAVIVIVTAWRPWVSERMRIRAVLISAALIIVAVALVAIPFGGTCVE
jgi:cytochrome bd-type quinol oxidase subunit 2